MASSFNAFTTRAPGKTLSLTNKILVSEAYDPNAPPTPKPDKKQFIGLWDTGATHTVVTERVVKELGLKPSGKKRTVHGVGSVKQGTQHDDVETYMVNITLPNQVGIFGVPVSGMKFHGGDVLIGMDIIGFGDFAITKKDGKTTWSFCVPSMGEIDFVKKVDGYQRKKEPWTLSPEEQRKEKNRKKRLKQGKK